LITRSIERVALLPPVSRRAPLVIATLPVVGVWVVAMVVPVAVVGSVSTQMVGHRFTLHCTVAAAVQARLLVVPLKALLLKSSPIVSVPAVEIWAQEFTGLVEEQAA
jgi:hypothetical protein